MGVRRERVADAWMRSSRYAQRLSRSRPASGLYKVAVWA